MNSRIAVLKQDFTRPLLADLMEYRVIGWTTAGALGIQGSLMALGLPGWWCPFRHVLGIPCPGCGLSRATEALLRGDWEMALAFHLFAPLVLAILVLIVVTSLLPAGPRRWLIDYLAGLERRFGLGAIGLTGMFLYWLARFAFFQETFFALVMN